MQSNEGLRKVRKGAFFGLRWQSAAATALFWEPRVVESGVALRLPPQSKFSPAEVVLK